MVGLIGRDNFHLDQFAGDPLVRDLIRVFCEILGGGHHVCDRRLQIVFGHQLAGDGSLSKFVLRGAHAGRWGRSKLVTIEKENGEGRQSAMSGV